MHGHGFQAPGGIAMVESFCQRLQLRSGMRVLDVGSDWGRLTPSRRSPPGRGLRRGLPAPVMVEISTERASATVVRGVSFLHGDVRSVPLTRGLRSRSTDVSCILYIPAGEQRSRWGSCGWSWRTSSGIDRELSLQGVRRGRTTGTSPEHWIRKIQFCEHWSSSAGGSSRRGDSG